MSDSVDIVEAKRDKASVETAIQSWLDSNSVTSIDDIEQVYEMNNRVGIAIVYTA